MHQRPFKQIDVFSTRPGDGNALAVVIEACDLTDTAMQRFAAWMNLSETTFLLPPTEAARAARRTRRSTLRVVSRPPR